jgi:ABC-type oligopeptide transport system substrate-binding subunit
MTRCRGRRLAALLSAGLALSACGNDPYPGEDAARKVRYSALPDPPKTLDPAVSYTSLEHALTANVYDTLLEYHYLKRPYELIAGLAEEVPRARELGGGRVAYRFRLRAGALYADDPCFAIEGGAARTREIVAGDVAFGLMRIADPAVGSPVVTTFEKLEGLHGFGRRLAALRDADPAVAERRLDQQ